MEVVFRPKTCWTLLPFKQRADKKTAEEDAEVYAQGFRWLRRTRVPMLCWPWRLAQEAGWMIPSPVDILLRPVEDNEVSLPDPERNFFKQTTGLTDLWQRGDNTLIVSENTNWLRLYEADFDGQWDNMLLPLGEGFLEWRLGFEVEIPADYYLMIVPINELEDVEVSYSFLTDKDLAEMNRDYGLCLNLRPKRPIEIRRRQPIARIMLLHADSLHTKARFEPYASEDTSGKKVDTVTGMVGAASGKIIARQPHPILASYRYGVALPAPEPSAEAILHDGTRSPSPA